VQKVTVTSYNHDSGTLLPLWLRTRHHECLSREAVAEFVALMKAVVSLPPVGVVLWSMGALSSRTGAHRTAASLRCGFTHIPAILNPQSVPGDTGQYFDCVCSKPEVLEITRACADRRR
jgi:hypothetical protein